MHKVSWHCRHKPWKGYEIGKSKLPILHN